MLENDKEIQRHAEAMAMYRRREMTELEIIWRAEENKRRRRFWAIYFLVVSLFFIGAKMTPNGYWWIARHIELWKGIFIGSVIELLSVWLEKWCGDRLAWLKHFSWQ